MQGYGFLSFARKFGDKGGKKLRNTAAKTGINAAKKFADKYGKNLKDTAKKSGIDAAKIGSKKVAQKTAEASGDLIGINYSIKDSKFFNYKTSITGKLEGSNVEKQNAETVVPLKYLSKFWKTLDMLLINCEVSLV